MYSIVKYLRIVKERKLSFKSMSVLCVVRYIEAILCSGLTTSFMDVLFIHACIAFLSFRSRTMKETLQLKTVSRVKNFVNMVS